VAGAGACERERLAWRAAGDEVDRTEFGEFRSRLTNVLLEDVLLGPEGGVSFGVLR
jgi:hypothetical protein